MKRAITICTAGLSAVAAAVSAAHAQDPYASAYESMSQQQFVTQQSRINAHTLSKVSRQYNSRRHNSRTPTSRQVAACAQKSRFRSQFGAGHPKVRQLYDLCRGVGL